MNAKKRLGELLIDAGVINETQLQGALAHQRKWGGKLGQALVELKLATEPQIVAALSRKLGYEIVNVAALPWNAGLEAALKLVPSEVALRQTLLPIAADGASITVAMSDPSNIAVVDELAFRTGRRVKIALAGDRAIAAAVQRFYFGDDDQRRRGVAVRAAAVLAEEGNRPAVATAPRPAARGDGAGVPVEAPTPLVRDATLRPLTPREAAMLDALQRAVRGEDTPLVKQAQLPGLLTRVLLRKGLVTEAELVEELTRP